MSRATQLERLLSLAEILGQTIPFEEKVTQVWQQLVETAEGRSAHFRVPSETGEELIITASAGVPDTPAVLRPAAMGKGTLVYEAYQWGEPLIVHDLVDHPGSSQYSIERGDRSAAFIPVGKGPKPIAVVAVDSGEPDHFTPDRVRLLTAVGEELGTMLENSRLSDELQTSTQEMTLVDQVADIITSSLDIDQLFMKFANEVRSLLDFNFAAINNVDQEAGKINQHSVWTGPSNRSTVMTWDLEGSQTEQVMATGQTIIQNDLAENHGFSSNPYFHGEGLNSTVLSPLIYNDRVIGSVSLGHADSDAYRLREQRILERLARQIAPAVENARLYEESVSRTAQLECLLAISNILGEATPQDEKIERILEEMVKVVDAKSAFYRILDEDTEELVLTASAGNPDPPQFNRPERVGPGTLGFEAYKSGKSVTINDYQEYEGRNPDYAGRGDRSIVIEVINVAGKPAATVFVETDRIDHFNPARVQILAAVGEGLGTLLDNDCLGSELQSSIREIELVDQISQIITTTLDIDQVFAKFAGELRTLVEFRFVGINIIDRERMTYDSRNFIWGDSLETQSRLENQLKNSRTEEVMLTSQTIIQGELSERKGYRTDHFFCRTRTCFCGHRPLDL